FDDEIDTEDEECEEETLELGEIRSATSSVVTKSEDCEFIELNEDFDDEESEEEDMESDVSSTSSVVKRSEVKLPNLSVKEKKELASYAHSLGKKLKSQQVGKSGVTDSVAFALIETLEANELLKLKIHGSCPGELPDVVRQLEQATGSIAVGQIGRSVILYRPSLSKMREEEKKRQAQRIFLRQKSTGRPSIQKNELALRSSRRGRRGSSRFS
ncbi:RNA-binding, CRM domain, partial [Dillenia turbinata]